MVHNQQTDIVPVGHRLQSRGIPVVDAVGGAGTGCLPDFLQRVNDDQLDARVFGQHLIQLLLQPLPDHGSMAAEVQPGGCFLSQVQCTGVQSPRPVLQGQIEDLTFPGTEPEKWRSPADRQTKLQRQPAFAYLGRASQKVQPGCQQIFHHPRDGVDRLFVEFLERIGIEFI